MPSELLTQVVFRRVGVRRGMRALGVLSAWATWLALHDGERPTLRSLEGATERGRQSWQRDLHSFREAFPGEADPDRLARLIVAELERRRFKARSFQLDSFGVLGQVLTFPASVVV